MSPYLFMYPTICNMWFFALRQEPDIGYIVLVSLCLLPQASFPPVEATTASTTPPVTMTQEAVFVCLVSLDSTARSSLVGVPCNLNVVSHTRFYVHTWCTSESISSIDPNCYYIIINYLGIALCLVPFSIIYFQCGSFFLPIQTASVWTVAHALPTAALVCVHLDTLDSTVKSGCVSFSMCGVLSWIDHLSVCTLPQLAVFHHCSFRSKESHSVSICYLFDQ